MTMMATRMSTNHKFSTKNKSFAHFACAFVISKNFTAILIFSTTRNDLFCICVNNVRILITNVQFCLISGVLVPIL